MSRTNGFGAAAVKAVNPTVSEWYLLLPNARAHNIARRCVFCAAVSGFAACGSYWSEAASARARSVAPGCGFQTRGGPGHGSMQ